jgi:hypothetical protein
MRCSYMYSIGGVRMCSAGEPGHRPRVAGPWLRPWDEDVQTRSGIDVMAPSIINRTCMRLRAMYALASGRCPHMKRASAPTVCPRRLERHASRQPLPICIPYVTPDLLLKHSDVTVATYKKRHNLKQVSETLTKTSKNILKPL